MAFGFRKSLWHLATTGSQNNKDVLEHEIDERRVEDGRGLVLLRHRSASVGHHNLSESVPEIVTSLKAQDVLEDGAVAGSKLAKLVIEELARR
ncbi:hypothetical protein HYQ46_008461 [Verticillium longisporum]|nr:hypothetical protein HYQ46_008461 [Verticillium longisporum]